MVTQHDPLKIIFFKIILRTCVYVRDYELKYSDSGFKNGKKMSDINTHFVCTSTETDRCFVII